MVNIILYLKKQPIARLNLLKVKSSAKYWFLSWEEFKKNTKKGFVLMNEAIKKEAEKDTN